MNRQSGRKYLWNVYLIKKMIKSPTTQFISGKNIWTDFSLKKIKTANKHIQSLGGKKSTQKAVKIIIIQEIIIKITTNTTKMNNIKVWAHQYW